MEGFKHGNRITQLGQVGGGSHAGRAGTNHGHLDAVGFHLFGHGVDVFPIPVSHEPLKSADGYGLTLDTTDAPGFALGFLGADPAGKGGQSVGGGDDLISGLEVTFLHLGNELGNPDIDGAAFHTLGILTL